MNLGTPARTLRSAVIVVALLAHQGHAFSLLPDLHSGLVSHDFSNATRWSAAADSLGYDASLRDGLRVAVDHDFAADLGLTAAEERAAVEEVIRNAFAAWQTPELHFDIDFTRVPLEGVQQPTDGFDIDLFAVPGSHPAFGGVLFFGYTFVNWMGPVDRLLTNGSHSTGLQTLKSDIYINIDSVGALTVLLPVDRRAPALQRLLMHEIGHALGFGHPNTSTDMNANYDTDSDPLNLMRIDPRDPSAGLLYSESRNDKAIMSNAREVRPAIFFTALQFDDRGGRDTLYPSLTSCPADCDGNGVVDITELLTTINIALGTLTFDVCYHADQNGDEEVPIDEVLRGVNSALGACQESELFLMAESRSQSQPSAPPLMGVSMIRCTLER